MALLIYAESAQADFFRLTDFLFASDPQAAIETSRLVQEAVDVLQNHSFIGRVVDEDVRALLVSRGRSGYVVLYAVEQAAEDVALVLAIRHQREAGYWRKSDL